MIQEVIQITTSMVGFVADCFTVSDRLARRGTTELIYHDSDVTIEPQLVEIYVSGHCNSVYFQETGPGIASPQLSYGGHSQSWIVGIPSNVVANVYLSGHCNAIRIPRRLRSRVFTSTRGHCNDVV